MSKRIACGGMYKLNPNESIGNRKANFNIFKNGKQQKWQTLDL